MAYILGIDGGGSKTHSLLYNTETEKYCFNEYGTTSHEQLKDGFEGVKNQLGIILNDSIMNKGISIDEIDYSTIGLAGIDTKYQFDIVEKVLADLGLKNFTLCNDAYLGVKAGSPKGTGICLINGTGFNIVGINEHNRTFQSGAQFELTGDYGGGLILGKEAIKTVYLNLFRYKKETLLNEIIMSKFKIKSKYEYMDIITKNISECKIKIPQFAKFIYDAANLGDHDCIEILKKVGREYALSVDTLVKELKFESNDIDIILAGSLFTKRWNEISVNSLVENLSILEHDKSFNLIYLNVYPVFGALIWSYEELFGSGHYNTLKHRFDRLGSL